MDAALRACFRIGFLPMRGRTALLHALRCGRRRASGRRRFRKDVLKEIVKGIRIAVVPGLRLPVACEAAPVRRCSIPLVGILRAVRAALPESQLRGEARSGIAVRFSVLPEAPLQLCGEALLRLAVRCAASVGARSLLFARIVPGGGHGAACVQRRAAGNAEPIVGTVGMAAAFAIDLRGRRFLCGPSADLAEPVVGLQHRAAGAALTEIAQGVRPPSDVRKRGSAWLPLAC